MLDLSELPDGWRVVRLEDVAHVNPRRPRLTVPADLPTSFIPMAAVRENCQGVTAFDTRPYHEIAKGYSYFESNDVLFAKITPCLQNGKHALAPELTNGFGFGTTEFHVVRPGVKLDPKHLYRVLTQPRNISKCINSFTGTAGQQRVQPEVLRSLIVLLPPISEQRAIAAVLDAIDEAIEYTEAMISATERLRDALLHELLTRGVPGWHTQWRIVPGLGTLPERWRLARLGDVAELNRSNWDPSDNSSILYLDLTAVAAPGYLSPPKGVAASDAPSRARRRVHSGDILVSTVRPNLRGYARVENAAENLIASTGFAVLSPLANVDGSFVYHNVMTHQFARYLTNATTGQAYPAARPADVAAYILPIPPLAEQRAIATVLDSVDATIERSRGEYAGLQASKASLAKALLTGQVRWEGIGCVG